MNDGWISVNDAARQLGVSARGIYKRIKQASEPLESREIRGRTCVRLAEVYRHFEKHGRRPAGLVKPAEIGAASPGSTGGRSANDSNSEGAPEITETIRRALGADVSKIDLHELVVGLTATGANESLIRAVSTAANAVQKKRADAVRAGKSLAPEDVRKMLRDHGELIAEESEAGVPRTAAALLKLVRDTFGTDLSAKRVDAQQQIEGVLLEELNRVIVLLRKRVEDQVHGVQALELAPAGGVA